MEGAPTRAEPRVTLSFDNIPPSIRRRIVDSVRALLLNSSVELQTPAERRGSARPVSLFSDGSILDRDPGSAAPYEVPVYSVPPPPAVGPDRQDPLYLAASSEPTCWNCGSTAHRVPACPLPRDEDRIAAARPGRRDRYYALPDKQARFAHFRAGQLSAELRAALGLTPGQLPEWVLRWQVYGPPPHVRRAAQEAAAKRPDWGNGVAAAALAAATTKQPVDAQGDIRMESDEEGQEAERKRPRTEATGATETATPAEPDESSKWNELQRILRAERQQRRTPNTTPTKS